MAASRHQPPHLGNQVPSPRLPTHTWELIQEATSLCGVDLPYFPLDGGQAWGRRMGQATPATGEHRLASCGPAGTRTLAQGSRPANKPLQCPPEARAVTEPSCCDLGWWASGAPSVKDKKSCLSGGTGEHLRVFPRSDFFLPKDSAALSSEQPQQGMGCLIPSLSPRPTEQARASPGHSTAQPRPPHLENGAGTPTHPPTQWWDQDDSSEPSDCSYCRH